MTDREPSKPMIEADELALSPLQKAVWLARGGRFSSGDRNQPSGPLDEITRLAAVCRSYIHSGRTKMAAQCAKRLVRLARMEGGYGDR